MKGVRYSFPSGVVAEFTHTPECLQPAGAWVEAHKKAAKVSRVEEFESDVPVNRTKHPNGQVVDHLRAER